MFLAAFAIGFAFADVTGAGATTNTQSTTGSSATNTAITGGYPVSYTHLTLPTKA